MTRPVPKLLLKPPQPNAKDPLMIAEKKRAFFAVLFISAMVGSTALVSNCRAPGLRPGAPCTTAPQCEYQVCEQSFRPDGSPASLSDGALVGTCAIKCTSFRDCPEGLVCGSTDYRAIDPDSGIPEGVEHEIVRTCHVSANVRCMQDNECQGSQRCLLPAAGGTGICTSPCTTNTHCGLTQACLKDELSFACREPGLCAPRCDERVECPTGWRCELPFGSPSYGRCMPVLAIESSCPSPDAADVPSPTEPDVLPFADAGTDVLLDAGSDAVQDSATDVAPSQS